MIELSKVKEGEKVADLGSGDGRIAIAFAKSGALVDGFELDEERIKESRELIKIERLDKKIKIHNKNFWDVDLSPYDITVIYPMPDVMQELEEKLSKELKMGTRILLNYYPFPSLKCKALKNKVYLYIR